MPHYHTALSTSADTDLHKGRGDPELRRVFLSLLSAAETADQQDEKDDSESPAPVWEEADRDTALEVEDLLMEAYCTRIEPSWKPDPVEPVSSTQTRRVADGATAKSRPQGRQRTDIILPRLNCRSCDFRCRSSLVMFRHKMTEHRDFM